MTKLTIYDYVAVKNPRGAMDVVSSYGIRPIHHPRALAKQLADCVRRNGDSALYKIAYIHPDRELFQSELDAEKKKVKESHSNACGCSNFSNANGQQIKNDVAEIKNGVAEKSKTEMLIVGGIVLIGLALVLKK